MSTPAAPASAAPVAPATPAVSATPAAAAPEDLRLPFEETPVQRRLRQMALAGFRPSGEWDAFAQTFVSELPAEPGARIVARISFPKRSDGHVEDRPSSVTLTTHRVLPIDSAVIQQHLAEPAQTPLLVALEPYFVASTSTLSVAMAASHPATLVCGNCGMRSADWVRLGARVLCGFCAQALK